MEPSAVNKLAAAMAAFSLATSPTSAQTSLDSGNLPAARRAYSTPNAAQSAIDRAVGSVTVRNAAQVAIESSLGQRPRGQQSGTIIGAAQSAVVEGLKDGSSHETRTVPLGFSVLPLKHVYVVTKEVSADQNGAKTTIQTDLSSGKVRLVFRFDHDESGKVEQKVSLTKVDQFGNHGKVLATVDLKKGAHSFVGMNLDGLVPGESFVLSTPSGVKIGSISALRPMSVVEVAAQQLEIKRRQSLREQQ